MQYATYIRLLVCALDVLFPVDGDESYSRPLIANYSFCINDTITKITWQPSIDNSRAGWFHESNFHAGCSSLHIYDRSNSMYAPDSICHIWYDKSTDGNIMGKFCLHHDGDTRRIMLEYIPSNASLLSRSESSTHYFLTFNFVSSRLRYSIESEASNIALACSLKQSDAALMELSCTASVPAHIASTSIKMIVVQFVDDVHHRVPESNRIKRDIGLGIVSFLMTACMMVICVWCICPTVCRKRLGSRLVSAI
jgi:hypothetical protein